MHTAPQSQLPMVVFQTPDGRSHPIYPGSIIGRLAHAGLSIEDPRISEAHCLLSLRGAAFRLLGLRGGLKIGTRWKGEVDLREGMAVYLAEDYALSVAQIVVPTSILAIEGLNDDPVALDRPEWSLFEDGPRLEPRVDRDAGAWIWNTGESWWFQAAGGDAQQVGAGDTIAVGDREARVITTAVLSASTPRTIRTTKNTPPMVLDIWPEHTEIRVGDRKTVRLTGNGHRILRQTALRTISGGSVHWTQVAEQIWRVNATEDNWFTNHRRLQNKLREQQLPPDLVSCDNGQVQLSVRSNVDHVEIHDLDPSR